jgi:hypothetical protein
MPVWRGTAAVVLLVLLLAPSPAAAQRRGGGLAGLFHGPISIGPRVGRDFENHA